MCVCVCACACACACARVCVRVGVCVRLCVRVWGAWLSLYRGVVRKPVEFTHGPGPTGSGMLGSKAQPIRAAVCLRGAPFPQSAQGSCSHTRQSQARPPAHQVYLEDGSHLSAVDALVQPARCSRTALTRPSVAMKVARQGLAWAN